jgi:hypothetical protein
MCPKCFSKFLRIRKRTGFERIMIYFTGKRKYWCDDCSHVFREVDRRRLARFKESGTTDFLPVTPRPV